MTAPRLLSSTGLTSACDARRRGRGDDAGAGINALRELPGVQSYFSLATFAQASAAGYATGRVSAAHAVLRMAELLSVGFGLLCLAHTMAGARSAARDSALLLRVHGLSEAGGGS